MIPNQGDLIEIRFNNGVTFDAIVDTWSDQQSVVVLPDTQEFVVIQKTLQDVLLIKIIKQPNPQEAQESLKHFNAKGVNADNMYQAAELQQELNKQEKYRISRTLLTRQEPRKVNYVQPGNIQIASPTQHTQQKAPTNDAGFGSQLQDLFRKKD